MNFQILINLNFLERLKLGKEIVNLIEEKPFRASLRNLYFSSSKYKCYIQISKYSIQVQGSTFNKDFILDLLNIINKSLDSRHLSINLENTNQVSNSEIEELFKSNCKNISFIANL